MDGKENLPAPSAPEPSTPSTAGPSDQQVAQNWFDEWSSGIEERLGHLEQAVTHVAQSQRIGGASDAGHTTSQPGGATGPGAPQGQQDRISAPSGPSGVGGGQTSAGKPDAAPKSGHWYFKRLWGE